MTLGTLEQIIDYLELGHESSEIQVMKQIVRDIKWPLVILLGWLRNQPDDGHIKPLPFNPEGSFMVDLRLIVNGVGFLSDRLVFDEVSLRFKKGVEYKQFRQFIEDRWHPEDNFHVSCMNENSKPVMGYWFIERRERTI